MGWGISHVPGYAPVHPSARRSAWAAAAPAWNPRCLRHENGSNRISAAIIASGWGGCRGSGWVGSPSPGNLGLPAGGPGAVAGGEGRGGKPGAGLRCPGLLTEGQCPCVSGGALGGWHLRLWPAAGRPSQHPQGYLRQSASLVWGMARGRGWRRDRVVTAGDSKCPWSTLARSRTQAPSPETASGTPSLSQPR